MLLDGQEMTNHNSVLSHLTSDQPIRAEHASLIQLLPPSLRQEMDQINLVSDDWATDDNSRKQHFNLKQQHHLSDDLEMDSKLFQSFNRSIFNLGRTTKTCTYLRMKRVILKF